MVKINKNIVRKAIMGTIIAIASASAYAWCSEHTSCHGGSCITVKVCGPDPVFTPNP